jgi:hypothetical protein
MVSLNDVNSFLLKRFLPTFVLRWFPQGSRKSLSTYMVWAPYVFYRRGICKPPQCVLRIQGPLPGGGSGFFQKNSDRTIGCFATCRESTELMHILTNAVKGNMKADFLGPERLNSSMKTIL